MEEISRNGVEVISEALLSLPSSPGVYKMLGVGGEALYIGKAKDLLARVSYYTKWDKLPYRLKMMVAQVRRVETMLTDTESEALLLEASLISSIKPKFNIQLRDDKSFPYIAIDMAHPYPRVSKYRGKKQSGYEYFGPFASADSVMQTILEIQKLFGIRPCSNDYFARRTRPCLQYQIKRCTGPCVGKINEGDYSELIAQAKDFLSGKNTVIQDKLKEEMMQASEAMEYEKAAQIRNRIAMLSAIQARSIISTGNIQDADFISYYEDEERNICLQVVFIRNGRNYGDKQYFIFDGAEDSMSVIERAILSLYQAVPPPSQVFIASSINATLLVSALDKQKQRVQFKHPKDETSRNIMEFVQKNAQSALHMKLKEELQHSKMMGRLANVFGISNKLERIEVYDNSHIQGDYQVGCYIVAGPLGFIRNQYRTFNIKKAGQGDDYSMLREVLERRVFRIDESNRPDLMLIDGGAGHLSAAMEILQPTDIPVVCIAKGRDRNAGREWFFMPNQQPFQLPPRDEVLVYLQGLRNEAHRFAITSHRQRRAKAITKSGLDEIPGVGAKRKKQLLSYFGSLERIKACSPEDIARIDGVGKALAKVIYDHLHGKV
ncbi:MAG: excinuclease ABC subunit UvrC [Proteobacteria bacterium]|nr:excinuclease ABC subunit UvrC [Pseudomonadota bacterium]